MNICLKSLKTQRNFYREFLNFSMNTITNRIQQIKDNIAAACERVGRDPQQIKTIIVTKAASIESVKEILKLGFTELGENRLSHLIDFSEKIETLFQKDDPEFPLPYKVNWHMIGHLQRNKVRKTLKIASVIHSVDSLRLAEEIDKVASKMKIRPEVMLQVNCSEELQKYGVPVGALTHMAEQMMTMPNLKLVGLMTMGPLTRNKDAVRACFVRARELFEEIQDKNIAGPDFLHLSMGMSQDYEIAVEEGATILRIGSAIFA